MNPTMDRRTILRAALFSVPLAALGNRAVFAAEQTALDTGSGPYTLPPLPYKFDALEPYIDKKTMELHHDKHHATYVKNLNDAIAKAPELNGKTPEQLITMLSDVPEAIRTTVRNNAGGHVNHTMFWALMTPVKTRKVNMPTGALGDAIKSTFGSLENFQTAFNDAGAKRFGSGWVWLVRAKDGTLKVISTPNQDNPMMAEYEGATPIMGNDVWEHAYYLKYQNRRPEYLKAWWNTVNWDAVASRFAAK